MSLFPLDAYALSAAVALLAAIVIVSAWTPFLNPDFMRRWLTFPQLVYTAPVPLMVIGLAALLFRSLARGGELVPFLASLGLFLASYIGLAISFYPYIVPTSITIRDAAAPDSSLAFLLVGAAVLVPLILVYTGYSYWVFRGKVRAHEGGYH